jgi:hypothetical protein
MQCISFNIEMDFKGLWCLKQLTFNNISVISCGQFYRRKKPEYLEKTTDLLQVTDNKLLSHTVMLYRVHPRHEGDSNSQL